MSDWIITAPGCSDKPYRIEAPIKALTQAYDDLSPQYQAYTFIDAIKFVGYRMSVGDRILTQERST